MGDEYYLECENCGWQGTEEQLVCSEEDGHSDKPVAQIQFNLCPDCESDDIVSVDLEDEEE